MSAPGGNAPGGDDTTLRRLRMRAWRRGTREMDLILGPFADEVLPVMEARERATFEALLDENDHDLYQWIAGRLATAGSAGGDGAALAGPAPLHALIERIAAHAATRLSAQGAGGGAVGVSVGGSVGVSVGGSGG